ncbi:MAG: GntR family transcriptional regulator [Rhodoglobus sp.]
MLMTVSTGSATPPYEQIRSQVRDAVRNGTLSAGTKLPTVRRLAEDLGIAPNTVARAYRELEADGFIETRGRNGTVVSPQGDSSAQQGQLAARAFADRIAQLGLDPDDALAWVAAALRD